MLEIGKTLVSLDVIEKSFVCDISSCKGECCVVGESGAPITIEEQISLEESYPFIREYMTAKGIAAVEEQGWYVFDSDGDCVTPLIDEGACAYSYQNEKGITLCAFEKAYLENRIDFLKPLSCHLYPVRITKYNDYDAVNYEENKICFSACKNGEQCNMPLHQFLEKPLIRAYGQEWYDELVFTAAIYKEKD